MPFCNRGDLVNRIEDAGRRLCMDDGDEVSSPTSQCVFYPGGIAGATPLDVDTFNVGAIPLQHLSETIAEITRDYDGRLQPRLGQVGDGGFHPRRPGAGNRERQSVRPAAENCGEPPAHRVENVHQVRIEVAQYRRRQRLHYPIAHRAWPWPQKQPLWNAHRNS